MLSPALVASLATPEALGRVLVRALEDALTEATPDYWTRRAEVFEQARPRPDDFVGRATRNELAARDARLVDAARACRSAAEVARTTRPWWLAETLAEVA